MSTIVFYCKKFFLFLLREIRSIKLAFSYLTRFSSGTLFSDVSLASSLCWLPLIGLCLGFLATIPLIFFHIFSHYPLMQAWLYTTLLLWFTRALHLDGLVDLSDALGSGAKGQDFFRIMKDSQIGTFGAASASLFIAGTIITSYYLLIEKYYLPLIFAPMLSRVLPLVLSLCTSHHPKASLGKLFLLVPKKKACFIAFSCILLAQLFLPTLCILTSAILCGAIVLFVRNVAKREGGYSGDYFGFIISLGEIAVLISALAFH